MATAQQRADPPLIQAVGRPLPVYGKPPLFVIGSVADLTQGGVGNPKPLPILGQNQEGLARPRPSLTTDQTPGSRASDLQ